MTRSTQRIRAVITRSVAVMLLVMAIIGMAMAAWASTPVATWTTQEDFQNATVSNIDTTTFPGSVKIGLPKDFVTTATITCLTPNKIYATGVDRTSIAVIDTASKALRSRILLSKPAAGVVYNSANNKLYVGQRNDNKVLVIDVATDTVISTLTAPAVGNGAYAAGYNPTDNKVYISNTRDATMSILNGATDTLVAPPVTVVAGATTASFDAAADKMYLTSKGNQYVTVVDGILNHAENIQVDEVENIISRLIFDARAHEIMSADNMKLSWDHDCTAPNQKIQLQVRMADDVASLDNAIFKGPADSTENWYETTCLEATTATQTATVELDRPYQSAAEVRVKLSADGLTSPVVQEVRLSYGFTINASAGSGGTISPDGAVSVLYGDSQTFNIAALPCYHITDVIVDGVSQGPISSYTFANVTASHTISATFAINTYYIDASAGPDGSISPAGRVPVYCGGSETFTIAATSCYHITDVIVDGVSQGPISSYTFTNVTASHTILPIFDINRYIITPSAGNNGTIEPAGPVTVLCGRNQTFNMYPLPGYKLGTVIVDGSEVTPPPATYTFTNVTAPHTISATYLGVTFTGTAPVSDFFSTYTSGNGSMIETNFYDGDFWDISADGVALSSLSYLETGMNFRMDVLNSDTITVTGSAKTEKVFVGKATIVGHGVTAGTAYLKGEGNQLVFYDSSNTRLGDITFTPAPAVEFTATAGPNGSISPYGTSFVNLGGNRTFTMTPSAGYHVANVLVDGVSVGAVSSYTFNDVAASHTISATFAQNSPSIITASAGPYGAITPSGQISVPVNGSQRFDFTPNPGFGVLAIYIDGQYYGKQKSYYNFANVTTSHTIYVTFGPNMSASKGPGGWISSEGTSVVAYGGSKTYSIEEDAGYAVDNVLVDGASVGPMNQYTFTNITGPHSISVTFKPSP